MSASKHRNVNIPKKCKGCRNLCKTAKINYKNVRILECVHAPYGIPYLKDCPCGSCLVKNVCTQECEELGKLYDK